MADDDTSHMDVNLKVVIGVNKEATAWIYCTSVPTEGRSGEGINE